MIFVNFKTYEQGTGGNAVELAQVLEGVASSAQLKIAAVVQAADILEVVQNVTLEVWAQHIDPIDYGAHTGAILPESIKEDGATGTFLNHSEHKFESFSVLETAHKRAQELDLKTLVFAVDLEELKKVLKLKPTYVAYEPPELVGSQTTSVTEARPEIIAQAVTIAKEEGLPLIVGAGIKSATDVRKSIELGASGVAVASDIVKAKDPKKELLELIEETEVQPITALTTLSKKEKRLLMDAQIVLCRTLRGNRQALEKIGLPPDKIGGVVSEAEALCKR